MKVTRREFVAGAVAASAMPIGVVSAKEVSGPSLGTLSCIENDLKCLKDMRTKAYRAFVIDGRIGEIVALRGQALHRLGLSLSPEARSPEEKRLFREAADFLGRLHDSSIWLPWGKAARDRCSLLRAWGEAGGQNR
jgi:hypothetical protein